LVPSLALGLGGEYPPGQPVFGTDAWPKGLVELVNSPLRVHGFFVNWQDFFYFAGDTDKLNAFLKDYSELPGAERRVILHTGKQEVKSPWDKGPRTIAADWKLYATPFTREQLEGAMARGEVAAKPGRFVVNLEIWSGGQIDLDKLEIPAALSVEAGDDAQKDVPIQKVVFGHKEKHAETVAAQLKAVSADLEASKWIANALKEIQSIKPGMSRAELLKVVREEGGLSTRTQRRYAYRGCPYIKVDVKFEAVGEPDRAAGTGAESSQDKVTSVSQPFLEWAIGD
jgi:hypothetical protein